MLYANMTPQQAGDAVEKEIMAKFRRMPNICYPNAFADTRSASREGNVVYISPQPSDLIVSIPEGKTMYIEVKSSQNHACLYDDIKLVRNIQAAAAKRVCRLAGYYYFVFADLQGHRIKIYDGMHVPDFYHKKSKEKVSPIIDYPWADRQQALRDLITQITGGV